MYFSNGLKCSYTIYESSLDVFEKNYILREPCMLRTLEDTVVGFMTTDIRIFFLSKLDEPMDFEKVFNNL